MGEATDRALSMKIQSRMFFLFFALLLCLGSGLAVEAPAAAPGYSIMMVGRTAPTAERSQWLLLMQRVAAATGISFRLQIPPTLGDFERRVLDGDPDFAFVDPYLMVRAHQSLGYLSLLRDSSRLLQGVILVRQDSPIRSLRALNKATIAFPAVNTFPDSLQIRQLLARERIAYQPHFAGNFGNALRQVLYQEAEAAATTTSALGRERPEIQSRLRVLYVAPPVSPYVLAAHPRVPLAARRAVEAAILALADTAAGARLLDDVDLSQPVAASYEIDYKPMEMLGLAPFVLRGNE